MRTIHLHTICASLGTTNITPRGRPRSAVKIGYQMSVVPGSQATRFHQQGRPRSDAQVGHQMSVAEGSLGLMSKEEAGVPYHVTYPIMHLILPTYYYPCGQKDACENITFP